MTQADPVFPPLLKGHDIRGSSSPFDEAARGASSGQYGAGDVIWSRNTVRGSLAIVLEPEVVFEKCVQMIPLAMVACGDCIGSITPPKVAVTFVWPGTILVNGGIAGRVQAGISGSDLAADKVPDWMVVSVDVELQHDPNSPEPGYEPDKTVLAEEGCRDLTRTEFIESVSRHFLTWINIWQDEGFRPVHDSWMFKAEGHEKEMTIELKGTDYEGIFQGLDENGNLLLKQDDGRILSLLLSDAMQVFEDAQLEK